MNQVFVKQKAAVLAGVDLSRKGSIDEAIAELVIFINQQQHYVTTSSCSGRIALFSYPSGGEIKKKGCKWLYITHNMCSKADVMKALHCCHGDVFFKFEAFVLHAQCATIQHAQTLLAEAVASGYRNSGISIGKKGKIITAVRSTHSLEVPLTHAGKLLVSEEYIDHLVNLGNERMTENLARITRFSENLKAALVKTELNDELKDKKQRKPKKTKHLNSSPQVTDDKNYDDTLTNNTEIIASSDDEEMDLNIFDSNSSHVT